MLMSIFWIFLFIFSLFIIIDVIYEQRDLINQKNHLLKQWQFIENWAVQLKLGRGIHGR